MGNGLAGIITLDSLVFCAHSLAAVDGALAHEQQAEQRNYLCSVRQHLCVRLQLELRPYFPHLLRQQTYQQ